jgi:hypothetical protein
MEPTFHKKMNTCNICNSFCPSRQWGCCTRENTSKQCAGPVHLTGQWDIGSRPCCIGAGQKYTAMGGLINYCSMNGGKEYQHGTLAPYPLTNTAMLQVPKINPIAGSPYWSKYQKCSPCNPELTGIF